MLINNEALRFSATVLFARILFVCVVFNLPIQGQQSSVSTAHLNSQLEIHANNKKKVLELIAELPKLKITKHFAMDFREIWRRIMIDGNYAGSDKLEFLQKAQDMFKDENMSLPEAIAALSKSHQDLFGAGKNKNIMVRSADDPAFRPFGVHMSLAQVIAQATCGNEAEVQAFQTIFETGQNTRGYVHKLECHAEATEFIYAVTDIVYGVMLPSDLSFGPKRVVADPKKVQLFYVRAGEVIALHPYVLHSGSLSVEPDRSFSVVIYKKPVEDTKELVVKLPESWTRWQNCLKIENVDKFYLTLEELHSAELKTNCGYIEGKKPMRLPVWQ